MSDMSAIMLSLRPNNNWFVENETLTWEDDLELKPTDAEIEAKRIELQNKLPMKILRRERDIKLKNSDVYSLPDFPHSNETTKQAWLTYRQQLRDLPANSSPQLDDDGILTNVVFPTPPS
tara:strand:- start:112 stop:471 length:360 start_codon:yes stop_codon:yes gene_type:complete